MSKTISSWTTIILRNLRVPLSQFDKEGIDYEVREAKGAKTGKTWLAFEVKGVPYIAGKLERGERVHITRIAACDKWILERLERMLVMSTGRLRGLIAWDGCQDFSLLDSDNGRFSIRDIDVVEMFAEGGFYDQGNQQADYPRI